MGNDLQIRRVEVTVFPGQDGSPITLRAYEQPDSHLPLLLPADVESRVLEAVAISMAPRVAQAAEMASLLASLLDHIAERVSIGDGILTHPDGEPVVSENWVTAYNGLHPGLTDGHSELWAAWAAKRCDDTRDALVVAYQPLIRQIVASLRYPRSVDPQDLVSHGQFGLIDAIERFEPERGVRFEVYARRRIWGAINDGRRSFDWASRDMRDQAKSLARANERLLHTLHRDPTDRELAGELRVDEIQVRRMRQSALIVDYSAENPDLQFREDSVDGVDQPGNGAVGLDPESPENLLDVAELRETVVAALATVTGPEKILLYLYYLEQMRMADIGELFGVAPSMVAKLHTRAVRQVQVAMREIGSAWS